MALNKKCNKIGFNIKQGFSQMQVIWNVPDYLLSWLILQHKTYEGLL